MSDVNFRSLVKTLKAVRSRWILARDQQLECSAILSTNKEERIQYFADQVARLDRRIRRAEKHQASAKILRTVNMIRQARRSSPKRKKSRSPSFHVVVSEQKPREKHKKCLISSEPPTLVSEQVDAGMIADVETISINFDDGEISGIVVDEWPARFERDDSVDTNGIPCISEVEISNSQKSEEADAPICSPLVDLGNCSSANADRTNQPRPASGSRRARTSRPSPETPFPDAPENSIIDLAGSPAITDKKRSFLMCSEPNVVKIQTKMPKEFHHRAIQPVIFLRMVKESAVEMSQRRTRAETAAEMAAVPTSSATVHVGTISITSSVSAQDSLVSVGDKAVDDLVPRRPENESSSAAVPELHEGLSVSQSESFNLDLNSADPASIAERPSAVVTDSPSVVSAADSDEPGQSDAPPEYSPVRVLVLPEETARPEDEEKRDPLADFGALLDQLVDSTATDAERERLLLEAVGMFENPLSGVSRATFRDIAEEDSESSESDEKEDPHLDELLDEVLQQHPNIEEPPSPDPHVKHAKVKSSKVEEKNDDEIDAIMDGIDFDEIKSDDSGASDSESQDWEHGNFSEGRSSSPAQTDFDEGVPGRSVDSLTEEEVAFAEDILDELESEYAKKELERKERGAERATSSKDVVAKNGAKVYEELEDEEMCSDIDSSPGSPKCTFETVRIEDDDQALADRIKELLNVDIFATPEKADAARSSKRRHSSLSSAEGDSASANGQGSKKQKKKPLFSKISKKSSGEKGDGESGSSSDESGFAAPKSPRKSPSKRVIRSDDEDEKPVKPAVLHPVIQIDTSDSDEVPLVVASLFGARKVISLEEKIKLEKTKLPPMKRRKKLFTDADLCRASKRAVQAERDRKIRINDLETYDDNVLDKVELEGTVVDQIVVHPNLWSKLREHQQEGVRFLYQNVIETWSYQQTEGAQYGGCILAHSMGLGKTVQVISLLQAIMVSQYFDFKTALVVCPASTVLNWRNEFEQWMNHVPEDQRINVFAITAESKDRFAAMRKWKREGGVLVVSYHLFVAEVGERNRKERSDEEKKAIIKLFQDPGADIIICDEAHTMKKAESAFSIALNAVATSARIALTGTPLQNNLDEYWTMVNFLKPNLLGVQKEFRERFRDPIVKGCLATADRSEQVAMKKRTHILHETLDACLQVRGYEILLQHLPPKVEHVIKIRMSPLQIELYQAYIRSKGLEEGGRGQDMLTCYKSIQLISFHPKCLKNETALEQEKISRAERKAAAKNREDEMSVGLYLGFLLVYIVCDRDGLSSGEEDITDMETWFEPLLARCDSLDEILGPKALMVREIILQSIRLGEKILVFSDRLAVLTCVEEMLIKMDAEKIIDPSGRQLRFKPGVNVLAFDGQTSQEKRYRLIKQFHDSPDCHVFLLSIKAAGIGINLVGASRVILIEPMWNPTTDKQALFRTYRYGQTKPVHVYRFVTAGIAEEKIHDAQVQKSILYERVMAEKHGKRHQKMKDFFKYRPHPFDPTQPYVPSVPPADPVMMRLITEFPQHIVATDNYDSLLEPMEGALPYEESAQVWADWELEQDGQSNPLDCVQDKQALLVEMKKAKKVGFTLTEKDISSWSNFVQAVARHAASSLSTKKQTSKKKTVPAAQDKSKLPHFLQTMRSALDALREAIAKLPVPTSSAAPPIQPYPSGPPVRPYPPSGSQRPIQPNNANAAARQLALERAQYFASEQFRVNLALQQRLIAEQNRNSSPVRFGPGVRGAAPLPNPVRNAPPVRYQPPYPSLGNPREALMNSFNVASQQPAHRGALSILNPGGMVRPAHVNGGPMNHSPSAGLNGLHPVTEKSAVPVSVLPKSQEERENALV